MGFHFKKVNINGIHYIGVISKYDDKKIHKSDIVFDFTYYQFLKSVTDQELNKIHKFYAGSYDNYLNLYKNPEYINEKSRNNWINTITKVKSLEIIVTS